jgi:sugar/nucleoside kinase (ribokinase family)
MPLFYLAAGHITEDILPDGSTTPGGTVSFSALTAHNLGARAAILTASPEYLRHLPLFHNIEIAGKITEIATRFENIYTEHGRIQYLRAVAPPLETAHIPPEFKNPDILHLGPVAQEIKPELARAFPDTLIGVTPQGWMRAWGEDMRVRPILWAQAEEILESAGALVLSEEDLPEGEEGQRLLESYVARCPVVAYTLGYRGCTVFWQGKSEYVPAFKAREVDPTGCGDVFATAFFLKLKETSNPSEAALFANAAASINIERPGISGAPTLSEVLERLKQK